jgi:hypothetical protein
MNTELKFNDQGLLVPAGPILTDLEVIKRHFVDGFPKSRTRARLFGNFERYISQFQSEVFPWFEVWVDGSFVTRKDNPKDVDVVILLDYRVYSVKIKYLDIFFSFSLEKEGIDAYIVPVFPEGHDSFEEFIHESGLWHLRFTENRREGRKGYLKMNIGKKVG